MVDGEYRARSAPIGAEEIVFILESLTYYLGHGMVGGDKSGQWDKWYRVNVPLADDLFDAHLDELKAEVNDG